MKQYLILRLINAAMACDRLGDHNMAALLTEAVDELEKCDETKERQDTRGGTEGARQR